MRRALALLAALGFLAGSPAPWAAPAAPPAAEAPARPGLSLREAFERRRSGVWLRARGEVSRLLRDDLEGQRHQRFILRLPDGMTVLISHNIGLAPRVPAGKGDAVEVFGRYEWNKRGGVIHWTHRDPKGRREGGWIEHKGERYR
ncbi:MAG: DUF3465 domain-containing protein [Candidatus Tectomicrobia bacterium]|nr:DUF3465 domain-containing protein [Candidatus Tectomicrobia bacterium]